MRIAVYCGSINGKDPTYREGAIALGTWIAEQGHELVFGGSDAGLMSAVCNAALDHGGKVYGVSPDIPFIRKQLHPGLTEVYLTSTMAERKSKMMELSDAYVALPGGIGTLDEITEVICLGRIGVEKKPCVMLNINGYYEPYRAVVEKMIEEEFVKREEMKHLLISDDMAEIGRFLESR